MHNHTFNEFENCACSLQMGLKIITEKHMIAEVVHSLIITLVNKADYL